MRRFATGTLILANIVALFTLCASWFDSDGMLRSVTWTPPEPVKGDATQLPFFVRPAKDLKDIGELTLSLDRPLFAPDRKPPPPPPPPAPPPIPDSLADARLLGLVSGVSGGVILRAEGQVKRLRLNQSLGEWTLKAVGSREATFARGEETRLLRLEYASLKPGSPQAGPNAVGRGPTLSSGGNQDAQRQEIRAYLQAQPRGGMKR